MRFAGFLWAFRGVSAAHCAMNGALRAIVCTAPAGVRMRKMSAIGRNRDPADDRTK
jgi:hypothetical protein